MHSTHLKPTNPVSYSWYAVQVVDADGTVKERGLIASVQTNPDSSKTITCQYGKREGSSTITYPDGRFVGTYTNPDGTPYTGTVTAEMAKQFCIDNYRNRSGAPTP